MVVIKDMTMPKNCAYCRFRIYDRCYITDKRIDNYNCPRIKDGGCPLGEAICNNADMVAMFTELKQEIDKMSDSVVEGRTVTITSWGGMQKRICELIQSKIEQVKGE